MASCRDAETPPFHISSKTQEVECCDLRERIPLSAVEKYRLLRETRRAVRRERLAGERKSEAHQER